MTYKVFISRTPDKAGQHYAQVIKTALWRVNELPLAPLSLDDVVVSAGQETPLEIVQRVIRDADVFIGVYAQQYGTSPAGQASAWIEVEYEYAMSMGLPCLIFIPQADAPGKSPLNPDDKAHVRLHEFKMRLMEAHVVNLFSSDLELGAKVTLEIAKFKKREKEADRKVPLPPLHFRAQEEAPAEAGEFESRVWQALDMVDEALENIVRRAIEVYNAQAHLGKEEKDAAEGLTIWPIFGPPSDRSQFRADIFMIMPFREAYNTVYENIIKPVAAELNLSIKRGDEFASLSGSIINEVWAAINACRMVIVETTEINANVYYELGIAHTLGKPAVLLTQAKDIEELPFDIRHLRFIVYENTISGGDKLKTDLKRSIIWLLNDLKEAQAAE